MAHPYNLDLDIYKVFHFNNTTVTEDEIKKRYRKLSLKFHPDMIKNKRPLNDGDHLRWADIQMANDILSDENKRIIYDSWRSRGKCNNCIGDTPCGPCASSRFQCPECLGVRPGSHDILQIWQNKPEARFSRSSLRYFCRAACAAAFKTRLGYTDAVHGYDTSDLDGGPPPPKKNPEKVCPGCNQEKKFPDQADIHLYKRINWVSLEENSEKCCSDYCLDSLLRKQKKNFTACSQCNKVLKWNDKPNDWKKKKGTNNYFCSVAHMNKYHEGKESGLGEDGTDPLRDNKNDAIADIDSSLHQDPQVGNSELETANQNWRQDIENANDSPTITAIKNRVLADIQNKRRAKSDGPNPLLGLKNTAIAEIDGELLKDPEIQLSELETANKNYGANILTATSEDQINQIKNRVLADIRAKRQAKTGGGGGGGGNKNLDNLRQQAINQIQAELSQSPAIEGGQLTNPNWETEINQAQNENKINEIRDQVLANIRNKRALVAEKNRINELLTQSRQKENWNDYQNLANIFSQIKELRSSNGYEEKKSEIQAIENRLQELDPKKYKETQIKLLDQQIKNNKLTDSNMDEETKAAIAEAKADPSKEKITQAEEKICQNGSNNNLIDLLTQIQNRLKKGNLLPQEKHEAITKIIEFITAENKYQKQSYEKQKPKVDALLAELQGKESQDSTNSDNNSGFAKVLVPILIVGLLGTAIAGLLIWRKRKRLRNRPIS